MMSSLGRRFTVASGIAFAVLSSLGSAAWANWKQANAPTQTITLGTFNPTTAAAPGSSVAGTVVTLTPNSVTLPAPTSSPAGVLARGAVTITSWSVHRTGTSAATFACSTAGTSKCTDTPGAGTYSYTVAPIWDSWTGNASTAVTGVQVVATSITVSSSSAKKSHSNTVTVSGSGFAPNSALTASVSSGTITTNISATTDASGNVQSGTTFVMTNPSTSGTVVTVTVTDASSNSAQNTFTTVP